MENILKRTFDYERFSSSERLGAMIAETHRRYQTLNDEDLFLVSAAGETDIMNSFPENRDGQRERNL